MVYNLSGYINFSGRPSAINSAVEKSAAQKSEAAISEQEKSAYSAENVKAYQSVGIGTNLADKEISQKYNEISSVVEPETKVALSSLLKAGVLLNNKSNDGSTVLDNLYKIISEPRITGLNSKTLVTEAIETIANPGKITQTFGDIPQEYSDAIICNPELGVRTKEEMELGSYSQCCVAASLEYNLAASKPAEFARMAAGLSSEDYSVTKDLKLSTISPDRNDALWLLDTFKLPYQIDDKDNIKVLISPDRNAIIRARVQTSSRDPWERSSLDVLMQSAIMNVGAQQTYNSLNDTREPLFNNSNTGLCSVEKAFTEEVVQEEALVPVIYMAFNEDGTIGGRACDYETMAAQLITALQTQNVIIGYYDFNNEGQPIGGHEITIIGAGESPSGDLVFVCNDTNDETDEPMYILAQNLLPRLYNAGLPQNAIGDVQMPTEFEGIKYYREEIG